MKTLLKLGIFLPVLLFFYTGPLLAGKPVNPSADIKPDNGQECINLSRIERLEVINDQVILFHMKNHKIYKNTLPYSCPLLGLGKGIVHRTTVNRICKADSFRVLTYGSACAFGMFEPYSKEAHPKNGK